jgi:hypothetical protein
MFERLEPPPGGLLRLQRRLRDAGRPAPRRTIALAVVGLALFLLVLRDGRPPGEGRLSPALAIARGRLAVEPVVSGEHTAVERISVTATALVYRIAVAPGVDP